uniref:DUF834 domain-containing protein n=1 Tax=Oryza nivara TaxID=4536 RepID=A0A0E0G025_ORYNI
MATSSLRKGETRGFGSSRSKEAPGPGRAPVVGVRDAEEGYIGVRAEDSGIDSEPVGALAVAGAGAVDAEVGEARRAGEAEGDMDAYAGGGGGEGGGGVGDGIGGDVSSVFEVHPAWAHAGGGVVVGRQRRRKQQG